jgi:hypothetical protein
MRLGDGGEDGEADKQKGPATLELIISFGGGDDGFGSTAPEED